MRGAPVLRSTSGWARAADGAHLAYRTSGTGPCLLYLAEGFLPIDCMEAEPALAHALRRLSLSFTVVRFDRRGVGRSDPAAPERPPSLEQAAEDAVHVLDALGRRQAVVFAPADAGLVGITLAARHPERVARLVLVNAYARLMASEDHVAGLRPDFVTAARRSSTTPGRSGDEFDLLAHVAPSVADDARFRSWWEEAGRQGASPATARALREVVETSDVRRELSRIRVPTLVLHRRDNHDSPLAQGQHLRDHIAGARLVELAGADGLWWVGAADDLLAEVEAFVGAVLDRDPDRMPVTLLMTDLVESTATLANVGDRRWRQLLEEHDRLARALVEQCDGVHLDDSGDGLLAAFEDPAAAVRCARELQQRVPALGLQVRAGAHAGEVELRGQRVAGLAVHVVARVCALAGPGQLLLTRQVVDLLGPEDAALEPAGVHSLRGVPADVELLSMTMSPAGQGSGRQDR